MLESISSRIVKILDDCWKRPIFFGSIGTIFLDRSQLRENGWAIAPVSAAQLELLNHLWCPRSDWYCWSQSHSSQYWETFLVSESANISSCTWSLHPRKPPNCLVYSLPNEVPPQIWNRQMDGLSMFITLCMNFLVWGLPWDNAPQKNISTSADLQRTGTLSLVPRSWGDLERKNLSYGSYGFAWFDEWSNFDQTFSSFLGSYLSYLLRMSTNDDTAARFDPAGVHVGTKRTSLWKRDSMIDLLEPAYLISDFRAIWAMGGSNVHNISCWTLTFSPFWASHPNHGPLTGHVLNMFNGPTGCMWLAVSTASKEISPFRSSSYIPVCKHRKSPVVSIAFNTFCHGHRRLDDTREYHDLGLASLWLLTSSKAPQWVINDVLTKWWSKGMKNGDFLWDSLGISGIWWWGQQWRDSGTLLSSHTIPSGKPCSALVVMLAVHPVATLRALREITHVWEP